MRPRYLITGGAGFIGRVLCRHLLAQGSDVVVLDDLSTGNANQLPRGIDFVRGDVCDKAAIRHALDGVDGVFHLAAIASVQASLDERSASTRINLHGTVTLLEQTGPRPVVYTSSAAVYGEQTRMPIPETATLDPISPYAVDKLGSEKHLAVAARLRGARTAALRLFNVFGPGQASDGPYSGVITRFTNAALDRGTLRIDGDGAQSRDFVHVEDVARALTGAMDVLRERPPGSDICLNVCSGHPTTVADLASRLIRLAGPGASIAPGRMRAGDIRHSVGDPGAARAMLGFVPRIPLDQGLATLIADLKLGAERQSARHRAG